MVRLQIQTRLHLCNRRRLSAEGSSGERTSPAMASTPNYYDWTNYHNGVYGRPEKIRAQCPKLIYFDVPEFAPTPCALTCLLKLRLNHDACWPGIH